MNLKYFSKSYIPSKLRYRKEEQKKVRKVLRDFYEKHASQCLHIQGYTGCGKTATIKNLIQKEPWNVIYISGLLQKSHIDALRTMSGLSHRSEGKLLRSFIDELIEYPRAIIVDEISKIREHQKLVGNLNAIHREIEVPMIVVTNDTTFLDSLDNDVKTTLNFERVKFEPYTVEEHKGIIKQRLEMAEAEMPEGAIKRISGIAKRKKSARVGIEFAKKCILSDNFSHDFIVKIRKSMESEGWYETISQLTPTQREVLNRIMDMSGVRPGRTIKTTEVMRHGEVINKSTVSNAITQLEEYGIVDTEYVNEGRRTGRYRNIKINDKVKEKLNEGTEI